jgi:hypothetical protein
MRVIFDRSSFHGDRFELLTSSPLRRLAAQRRIEVFHTEVFLDELAQSYDSPRAAGSWRDHLKYAVQICNGGIFLPAEEIWRSEIVDGRGPLARRLLPLQETSEHHSFVGFQGVLLRAAETGDLSKEWAESRREREDTRRKKTNQHALFREAREVVAAARREGKLRGRLRDYPFSEYLRTEFVRNGRALMRIVDKTRATELADFWETNPEGFPYYTAFVEGFVYSQYYAALEHNRRLDGNEQADYQQLAHLIWSDLVVSDDQGFFRSAFDTLWRPRGKRMESTASFVELLKTLT